MELQDIMNVQERNNRSSHSNLKSRNNSNYNVNYQNKESANELKKIVSALSQAATSRNVKERDYYENNSTRYQNNNYEYY